MKKTTLVLVIAVFLLCAFFGYKFASKIIPDVEVAPPQESPEITQSILQENFLLIHNSENDEGEQELVSAWIALVYPSDSPQIVFMPVYPSYEKRIDRRIRNSFKLQDDGELSANFISQVEGAFDFEVSGYMVADDFAVKNSYIWLTGEEAPVITSVAETEEEKHSVRLIGQNSYQKLCENFSNGSGEAFFSSIRWASLLPEHLSTNLSFETFLSTADLIIHSGSQVQCNVMSGE